MTRYRVGDLTVDLARVQVTRGAEVLDLPGLTFDLLLCLLESAPSVVGHDRLVAEVWGGAAIADETITQRASLLRRALGDDPASPRYVATVRGRGYRLLPPVTPLSDLVATGPPALARPALARPSRFRWALASAVALAFVALVVVALVGAEAFRRQAETARMEKVLPVLSAAELTERGHAYLARHREEDNELAVELFRDALELDGADPSATIGLSLAFSQRATKFNRSPAWARRAEALARRSIAVRPGAAEAHHALGLALDAQGRVSEALAAYRRAATLDPRHAGAIASAAYLLAVRGELAEALRWNLRALALDADVPYVELQIAEILRTLGEHAAAEGWYRRALALRPDIVFVHGAYGTYLLERGDLAGAEGLARQALGRGIRRPEPLMIQGHVAWMQGREKIAGQLYRRAAAVNDRQSSADAYLAALGAPGEEPAVAEGATGTASCRTTRRSGADEWPLVPLADVLRCAGRGDRVAALEALDAAIDRGYRDDDWLLVHPGFASLRRDRMLQARIDRIRELIAAERARVQSAAWLPGELLGRSV